MFTRYLLRRFFRLFALVLLSTLFVYVLLDFVGNIKVWLQRDPKDVAEYYLNFVPNIVYLVMPVNLLLSVVGVVGSMARHLEIASMKTAGRSVLRITAPLLAVSVLIAGAMFWTTEEILPDANHRRLELAQPPTEQASKIRREKQKNRAVVVGENATYYFRTYSARSQRGHNVIVLKFDSLGVSERWDAMAMDWSDSVWLLRNGFHRTFLPNGESVGEAFRTASLEGKVSEVPNDFIDDRYSPDEMNRAMLRKKIQSLRRCGEDTRALETQYHFKLAGSMVSVLIAVIGIALAHGAIRGGLARVFALGLLLTFSYYILLRIGLVLGETGVLSPLAGAWFGNAVVGAVAVVLLVRSVKL